MHQSSRLQKKALKKSFGSFVSHFLSNICKKQIVSLFVASSKNKSKILVEERQDNHNNYSNHA